MPSFRSLLTYLVALALVFAGGLAGGFVFQHEPERDALTVQLLSNDENATLQTIVAGELIEVGTDIADHLGLEGYPMSPRPSRDRR